MARRSTRISKTKIPKIFQPASILSMTSDAIVGFDIRRRITFWNRTAELTYGWTEAEALGRIADDVLQWSETPGARVERLTRFERREEIRGRWVHHRRDGTPFSVETAACAMYDKRGKVVGFVAVIRDITDQLRYEADLDAQRQLLASVLKLLPGGVCLYRGADLRVDLVNPIYERVIRHERVQGKTFQELWSGQLPDIEAKCREVLATGEEQHASDEPLIDAHSAGTDLSNTRYVSWRMWRVALAGDAGHGVLHTLFDSTNRVRAEQELRAADRRKNEFIAVLSHELRNPLAPLMNGLHILERAGATNSEATYARDLMGRQARILERIVDDLLDVTRISNNKITLRPERLDLNELARQIAHDQRPMLLEQGLRFDLDLAADSLVLTGDRDRLTQLVGNLLHNAAKFTPQGGTVQLAVARAPDGRHGTVRVTDTGAGMHPDMVSQLFQPFVQADSTLDRSKGGLGLGLALAKGLAELHGGDLSARSEGPGKGAEFILRLPLESEPRDDRTATKQEPRASCARRVLIIEDHVEMAASLRMVLEMDGHEVVATHHGAEGLSKALAWSPDVVLCDIGLPGMSGYDVAAAFQADPRLKHITLVALSGYARAEDVERSLAAGFRAHLRKPPNLDQLATIFASTSAPSLHATAALAK